MKASVIAGVLLVVLLALVIGNACYLEATTARIADMVSALPEKPRDDTPRAVENILTYAKKHKPYLGLSVHFSAIDRMLELCQSLLIYTEIGDVMNYQITKATLLDAIEDMGRLEKVVKGRD